MIDSSASNDDGAGLPLVLVTVGGDDRDFEVLHDHLELVASDGARQFQSLIVARPDLPKMLYNVLCARIDPLPHVHIRRLGEKPEQCSQLHHETGTFFVSRRGKSAD